MKMKKLASVLACAVAMFCLCGCGESVDENKTPEQVKSEVVTLNKEQIQAKIAACNAFIEKKTKELNEVLAKVKATPLDKLLSEDTKKLNEQAAQIRDSIERVSAQVKAYADGLAEKTKENKK